MNSAPPIILRERRAPVDLASRDGPAPRGVWHHGCDGTGVDPETARKNVIASIRGLPTGRFTTPEEVATLVVMLSSKRTANVSGANFVIDGGLIKTPDSREIMQTRPVRRIHASRATMEGAGVRLHRAIVMNTEAELQASFEELEAGTFIKNERR